MNRNRQPATLLRRALAALLLLHVVAVMVLAASPRLHRWIHHDTENDADCAVVLFLHGGCDQPGAAPLLAVNLEARPAPAPVFFATAWVPSIFAASRIFEHAPPVAG